MTDTEPVVPPTGWEVVDGRLHRQLRFDGFGQAFAFMTRVADIADRLDHHPDWSNAYDTVTIDLVSHDAGRLTDKDVALATAINDVVDG